MYQESRFPDFVALLPGRDAFLIEHWALAISHWNAGRAAKNLPDHSSGVTLSSILNETAIRLYIRSSSSAGLCKFEAVPR